VNVTGVAVAAQPVSSSGGGFISPSQKLVQGYANNTTAITNALFNASMLNITSHTSGQQVPIGNAITISGTSMDDFYTNCKVYIKKNNLPFQNVTAAGLTGSRDYSAWKFSYTDEYSRITPGNTNNLTAKISCNEWKEEEEKSPSYSSSSNSNNNSSSPGTTSNTIAYANVNVIGMNQPPTAVAHTDKQEVNEGEEVILTGEDSSDPNGDPLTYLWKQTNGFVDNSVDIVNPTDAVAQFKVPDDLIKDTTFTFKLTVKDSYGKTSTDTISIDAIGNSKPVADAGRDIKAERGEEIILDGRGSYDPDPTGNIISRIWKGSGDSGNDNNNDGSDGSIIYLQISSNQPVARFTVPNVQKDTTFEFTLTVIDDEGAKDESKMKVEVKGNSKPVADAGSNKKAVIGEQITLDGLDSHDPDPTGKIVSYDWEQIGGSSPSVNLNSANVATPSFTIPNVEEDTMFEFTLTVTDNEGAEAEDKVEVEVEAPPSLPPPPVPKQKQSQLQPPVELEEEEEEEEHLAGISEESPLTMPKPIQELTQQELYEDLLEENWSKQEKEDDDIEEQEKTLPKPEDDSDDYYEKDNEGAQELVSKQQTSMEPALDKLPIPQQEIGSRSNGEEEEEEEENDDDREIEGIQVIDDYNHGEKDEEKGGNTKVIAAINENDDEEKVEDEASANDNVNDNIQEVVDKDEGEIDEKGFAGSDNTKGKDEDNIGDLFTDRTYATKDGIIDDISTNVQELIDGIMGKVKQNLNSIPLSFKLPSFLEN
jgi:REJ domain